MKEQTEVLWLILLLLLYEFGHNYTYIIVAVFLIMDVILSIIKYGLNRYLKKLKEKN